MNEKIGRKQIIQFIKKYMQGMERSIVSLIVIGVLTIPLPFITPYFFSLLVDDVMRERDFSKFYFVVAGFLMVFLLRLIFDYISMYCSNRILNRFSYLLRKDIWNKYLNMNFQAYEQKQTGELKMRLFDDVDAIGNFYKAQFVDYITGIGLVTISLVILILLDFKLAFLSFLIIPVVLVANFLIASGTKKINEKMRKVTSEYNTFTHNSLQYWREMKAAGAEKTFVSRFNIYRKTLAKLGMVWVKYWFFREIFNDFKSNYLSKAFVFIIGVPFVLRFDITVGELLLFSQCFSILFSSIDSVYYKNVDLKVKQPYYKRIFETLEDFKVDETAIKTIKHEEKDEIVFDNISFHYASKNNFELKDISFKINNGEYIAVVGQSGCGKTTLAKLLLGLYSTDDGSIRFNGENLKNIDKKSYYKLFGSVMQDSVLFNTSIKENLRMAKYDATEEEMISACKKVNMYDYIMDLPDKFDTIIGERGVKMSGGQKQRLVIAQALLKRPSFYIFDEATSSVDSISEASIVKSINDIAKDSTVFVISHRPSTVFRAKRIIVMEDGRIVAQGTHEELIRTNEFYKKLSIAK